MVRSVGCMVVSNFGAGGLGRGVEDVGSSEGERRTNSYFL